jgi:serine/threonine protein kinase
VEQLPKFDYLSELGGGEFGTVYLCRSNLTGELRAVKHIDLPSPATVEEWRSEAEALAACHNEHVVRIHHAAATSEGPVLVMDFLPGGNAEDRWMPEGGPVGDVVRCLLNATWGLAHLHNEGLLHRDLKPANLLFDDAGNTVIGDFGLAGQASDTAPFDYLPHIPPEVQAGGQWTQQADIYALGVTGWRLLGAPRRPDTREELVEALRSGSWPNRNSWPHHIHASLRKALRAAMHPQPDRRPASAQRLRDAILRAAPKVSWSPRAGSRWLGVDGDASYELTVAATRKGWRVQLARDLGSGPRRVKAAGCEVPTEGEAIVKARRVLDAMAARGSGALVGR